MPDLARAAGAPSGEKRPRRAFDAWRRLFTARWWLVPAATRPGEAGVVPAHAPWTRISSLAPNLRARAENCPRLPSQATSTTSDGEAATPPKNRMVSPHASMDEQRDSAGPAARSVPILQHQSFLFPGNEGWSCHHSSPPTQRQYACVSRSSRARPSCPR